MIKKEIYPKTQRLKVGGDKVYVTEKLDGSNLVFFKKNDILYVAQRKNIFSIDELENVKDILYKGLYQWLLDNKDVLQEENKQLKGSLQTYEILLKANVEENKQLKERLQQKEDIINKAKEFAKEHIFQFDGDKDFDALLEILDKGK